jgi:hypothetical protein
MAKYQRHTYSTDDAMLGDGNGNVRVDGKKRDCYVRVNGVVMRVRNTKTAFVNNLPVVVGYEHANPNLLQVLGVRERDGIEMKTNYGAPEHHELHEYNNPLGGNDVVYSDVRQLMPGRVSSAQDAFNIYVHRGMALTSSGVWQRLESADKIDLSSYQPGTGACYVLIYVNLQDGTIGKLAGTTATSNQVLDYTYIPRTPANAFPLAAVRLYDSQTIISEKWGYDGEIVDLRMAAAAGVGNDILLYSGAAITPYPPTGAGLLAANAAAADGDVIHVPPGSYTVTTMTVGTGVTIIGSGQPATIISGTITLANSVIMSDLLISKVASSASAVNAIVLPTGSCSVALYNVTVRATNTGAGDANAIYDQSNADTLYLIGGIYDGDVSGAGTAYAINLTNSHTVLAYSASLTGSISGSTVYYHGVVTEIDDNIRFGKGPDYTEIHDDGSIMFAGTADLYETVKAVTTTYTALAGDHDILCSAAGGAFTVILPTAVGITGKIYTVVKTDSGTNAVTVDAAGTETINGALTVILPQQYNTVTIISNGANWLILGGSILSGFANIKSITASYTATLADEKIYANATGGAITVTLPAAATSKGKVYSIKKIDLSANAVTIDGNASETIDGALTKIINTQWTAVSIYCNGSGWYVE